MPSKDRERAQPVSRAESVCRWDGGSLPFRCVHRAGRDPPYGTHPRRLAPPTSFPGVGPSINYLNPWTVTADSWAEGVP